MRGAILAACLGLAAAPAAAQTISGDAARGQLFPTRGIQLAVSRALPEQERAIMSEMVKEADRSGQSFRFYYYGSIAYSPSEGLEAESISGAFNYHSTQASDRAALAACQAAGGSDCQVAAHILPRGYEPGRTQLSFDATNAFRSTYRRIRGAKAFAISPGTGAWKMADGTDTPDAVSTAIALCNDDARTLGGPADCTAVIQD